MENSLISVGGWNLSGAQLAVAAGVLVLAFLVGWLVAVLRRSSKSTPPSATRTRSASDDAFLKGLSHLMADHTDQAIEEFTRAVTLNSDTVETYVVLGNLFRQKGEIERAVRIRQNIIARPNLDPEVRLQATYDLGLDYRKGGLFNRAAEAFAEVLAQNPRHVEALRQMVSLYEEMRDWENAFDTLKRLDKLTGEDSRPVLAHYKAERGKELMAEGRLERAEDFLNQAISVHKGCLDAYLHLGDLELARGRARKALSIWRKAVRMAPMHLHLVINRLAGAEEALGAKAVASFFGEIDPQKAEVPTLMALAEYHRDHQREDEALEILDLALAKSPGHLGVHRLRGEILLAQGPGRRLMTAYGELLEQLNGEWALYQCRQCGLSSRQLTWRCPRCLKWDTMVPAGTTLIAPGA